MRTVLKSVLVVCLFLAMGSGKPEPAAAFACGDCGWCLSGHDNPYALHGGAEGIHTDCIAVSGCPHPGCVSSFRLTPSGRDLDRMLALVEEGRIDDVRMLLRKYSGSVTWNRERQALQLRAPCYGDAYIGHIPLTDAQQHYLVGD